MSLSKQFAEAVREWAEVFGRRSMREALQFWRKSELTMPQVSTLMRLHHEGTCGVSEVGSHLGVTNAAASQMVEKLVQQGLLERAEDPHDRRAKQLTLTPKGRALIQKGAAAHHRWMDDLPRVLTSEQQAAIAAALDCLTEAARNLEAET